MRLNGLTGALALFLACTALAAGCAAAPPAPGPLRPPRLVGTARHFAGTPVSGPRPAAATAAATAPEAVEGALQAVVAFVALERPPEGPVGPLGPQARLIVANLWEEPIRPHPDLLAGARAGPVPDAAALAAAALAGEYGRAASLGELRGVLPPGVTAAFSLERERTMGNAASAIPHRDAVAILLRRARGPDGREALEIALAADRWEAQKGGGPDGGPGELRREMAVLDLRPLAGRNDFALVIPSPFHAVPVSKPGGADRGGGRGAPERAGAEDDARAILAVASVVAPPPPGGVGAQAYRAALAACRADLAAAMAAASFDSPLAPRAPRSGWTDPTAPAAPSGSVHPERSPGPSGATVGAESKDAPPADVQISSRALADPARRRAALYALARAGGARAAEEVALSADDPILATVTAAVAADLAATYVPNEQPAVGWAVERATLRALAGRLGAARIGQADLFLLRRAGPSGRIDEILSAVLANARDIPDLDRRLVEANRALLDDGDPAVRARAAEWLGARGLAPPGYDPFAPGPERRALLAKEGLLPGAR